MKKIILSVLFISAVSMTAFAAQHHNQQYHNQHVNQMTEFSFMGIGLNGEQRLLEDVDLNILQYENLSDFLNFLRNSNAPNGFPYIVGNNIIVLKNNIRLINNLDAPIEDLHIDDDSYFHIIYRYEQEVPQVEEPALIEDSEFFDEFPG